MLDRRIEVDDLVLDPDFVNERNNLYASLDDLQWKRKDDVSRKSWRRRGLSTQTHLIPSKPDPPLHINKSGCVPPRVRVLRPRELDAPLSDDLRESSEEDGLDPLVELGDPRIEVGESFEIETVDLVGEEEWGQSSSATREA